MVSFGRAVGARCRRGVESLPVASDAPRAQEIVMNRTSNRDRPQAPCAHRSGRVWIVLLTALLALGAAVSARAQSAGDPPSRAARLSEVAGQVWLYSPDSNEWIEVSRNRPLTTGDRIATDNGARAE